MLHRVPSVCYLSRRIVVSHGDERFEVPEEKKKCFDSTACEDGNKSSAMPVSTEILYSLNTTTPRHKIHGIARIDHHSMYSIVIRK